MSSKIDAFRYTERQLNIPEDFLLVFLSSKDFDTKTRKNICSLLGLREYRRSKLDEQTNAIATYLTDPNRYLDPSIFDDIAIELLQRPKKYVAFKYGTIARSPILENPGMLITKPGKEDWYGPLQHPDDEAAWYIRPVFLTHIQDKLIAGGEIEQVKYTIRWLCFARVTTKTISLHWRNFTAGDKGSIYHGDKFITSARFCYWDFVPDLFKEIEQITGAKVKDIDLEKLVLNTLWDYYRNNDEYVWEDVHIKAEYRGISLNAHSRRSTITKITPDKDTIDIEGIAHLARTIRKSFQQYLRDKYNLNLPNAKGFKDFDEVILRTIIREYDPLSYQCLIQANRDKKLLFTGKSFFGKSKYNEEGLPHLLFTYYDKVSDLEQLRLLLSHFDPSQHLVENVEQLRLSLFARDD